jgi:glycosyltransferase involved in cell wall biosynthesis
MANMQAEIQTAPQLLGKDLQPGINVIGYLRAINGTAQGSRLLLGALEQTGIPFTTIDYKASPSQVGRDVAERRDGLPIYDINLLCVNADMTPQFARDAGPEIFLNRYTIGTWAWETEELPPALFGALDFVDEVWVPSDYSRDAVQKVTSKPVFTFHHPIAPPSVNESATRSDLNLPEAYTFLFIFDYFSVARRKNAEGLVSAFTRAFKLGEGPVLVIKTINADARREEADVLRQAASGRGDIKIIDRYLPANDKDALIGLCDCYVSLHRAEGFGLTLAEAMSLGKPVIATGYSGNLEFMTEDNSYLVKWQPKLVGGDSSIYPATGRWAEPDIADAARLMRHVYEHQDEAAARARKGRSAIEEGFSASTQAKVIEHRVNEIRQGPLKVVARGGDGWAYATAMQKAALALARGPQVDMPTQSDGAYGAVSRGYRRMLRRLMRNSWVYQQEIGNSLLQALREVDAKRQREAAETSRRMDEVESSMREISASLRRIEDELARALDRRNGA